MLTLIKESLHKARKDYHCNSYEFINNCCDDFSMMTFGERRSIVKAISNKGVIKKGDIYLYQFLVDGGDNWSIRAIPELHKICIKYDIYPDN